MKDKIAGQAFETAVNKGASFLDKIEQLEAQAAAMRAALEAVMWDELETGARYCIWCAVMFGSDHLTDCQGHNALAADAGRELLEHLQAEAAAMREALHPLAALYHKRLDDLDDDAPLYQHCDALITVGDVRRAKAALATDVGRELPERLRWAERTLELLEAAGHVSQETANQAHKFVLSFEFEAEREP